jgi:hypothetical protein
VKRNRASCVEPNSAIKRRLENEMSSKNGSVAPLVLVSRQALEDAADRALVFLRAVSTQPLIRTALEGAGYTAKDHAEGWGMFFGLSGYTPTAAAPAANEAEDAVAELEAWERPWFQRARAALRHKHPEQEAFVFNGLVAARGAEAIAAMAVFLDRLDALDSAAERKATRKADHAALATLTQRGVTEATRAHLRERLVFVSTHEAPVVEEAAPLEDRQGALAALYAWLQDWSDTARVVVTRRDLLIRLGLAKRRGRAPRAVAAPPAPPAPPLMDRAHDDEGPKSRAA